MLYLGIYHTMGEGREPHWILLLQDYQTQKSQWYHSTVGPPPDKSWEVKIERNGLSHPHIKKSNPIALISHHNKDKVKASAPKILGKHCQQWVIDVLRDLETNGTVGIGTADIWAQEMTCNQKSKGGSKDKSTGGASSSKDPKK